MKNQSKREYFSARRAGFTLIELLTVIAIIAILASISAVAVPKYLEKAKIVQTEANMKNIRDGLSEYGARAGNTNGFPAAYGYIKDSSRDVAVGLLGNDDYTLDPYTITIGMHDVENAYQVSRFASGFDVNRDGSLSLFEYLPVGSKDAATNTYVFSTVLYTGSNTPKSPEPAGKDELTAQLESDKRPYIYVPFNSRQLSAARRYWVNNNDAYGANFDMTNADLNGRMFFPPPSYDGFVIIGNGVGGNDGGLSTVAAPGTPGTDYDAAYIYHVLGLRIAFLATRDWDPDGAGALEPDGLLDFEYQSRKDASPADRFLLPDGTNGFGAFIMVLE